MATSISLPFNRKNSTVMHIDLNSCFATLEQQANPRLRGKPVAVAAYTTESGCIVAPSVEAKKYGVKTGMRVREGKLLCPNLLVLPPDPNKYRDAHLKLKHILLSYTDEVYPKSIDEFVLNLESAPASLKRGLHVVAKEIKQRIVDEVGEWVRVSVGIGPNRFLAKTAAGLHKPDGLDEINHTNYLEIYQRLELVDLCGIAVKNAARLGHVGIFTVLDMLNANVTQLRSAFESVLAHHWYYRLRGWEIDDVEFARKSFGNAYSLPEPRSTTEELAPILHKLVHKTGTRLRRAGYKAQGVHVALIYRDGDYWHRGAKGEKILFDSRDIYKAAFRLLCRCPFQKAVKTLSVSVFDLVKDALPQLELFTDVERKERLAVAVDEVNDRYGLYCLTPGRMLGTMEYVPDRISFGGVKELLDEVTQEED